MSKDNKDLDDKADDALDGAKKGAENLENKAKDAADSIGDKAKNLADKAEDAVDSAKEKAKDLGEKASEKLEDAKEAAEEFGEKAKEKTKEFTEDTKKNANEFADDANKAAKDFKEGVKETFDPSSPDSGKTVAILAHITIIGWIAAIIMNSQKKTEFGSYYIRQTLGIWIIAILLNFIPIVGCFASLICLVLIVISLIAAANGKMSPTVGVGHLFQDWFKSL